MLETTVASQIEPKDETMGQIRRQNFDNQRNFKKYLNQSRSYWRLITIARGIASKDRGPVVV